MNPLRPIRADISPNGLIHAPSERRSHVCSFAYEVVQLELVTTMTWRESNVRSCPGTTAAWAGCTSVDSSNSETSAVPVAGHAFSEPGSSRALVAATDRFALQADLAPRVTAASKCWGCRLLLT